MLIKTLFKENCFILIPGAVVHFLPFHMILTTHNITNHLCLKHLLMLDQIKFQYK